MISGNLRGILNRARNISVTGQKPPTKSSLDKNHPEKSPPDNKPSRIIEEIISKYAVDANLINGWKNIDNI